MRFSYSFALKMGSTYSSTPVTQTLKGTKKQFEFAGNSSQRGIAKGVKRTRSNRLKFRLAGNSRDPSSSYRGFTVYRLASNKSALCRFASLAFNFVLIPTSSDVWH